MPGAAIPRYDYSLIDRLVIRAAHPGSYGSVKEWGDTQAGPLEQRLHVVFDWIDRRDAAEAAQAAERATRDAEWRQQEVARAERAAAVHAAEVRRDALIGEATRWAQARQIRAYLDAVRTGLDSATDPERARRVKRWLDESAAIANGLDPLLTMRWDGAPDR